jgi:HK97 family phage portal protein
MLPEIAERIAAGMKALREWQSGTPSLRLDLKAGGVGIDWYARNGFERIHSILTESQPAWSGQSVTLSSALNHSVVFACTRTIAEPMGFLPLAMLQNVKGRKRFADEHPMYSALQNAPNDEITAQVFRESLTGHCILQGNGYSKIIRRSGTGVAVELYPLLPTQVQVEREREGQKRVVYIVRESGAADKTYTVQRGKPQDILHVKGISGNGLVGYSILTLMRQSLGTAQAAEHNVAKFYANGGRVPYVLETSKQFKNDNEFDSFSEQWHETYSHPHKAPILENDLKYKQIGLSMADAQMLETRQFNIPELCRWFGISPHMVGDLSRATFSNIEQLALAFVTFTLSAWIKRWEQELWRCVLTPEEKGAGYFFKFNLNALLRGDFASRIQGLAQMLQNGIINIDEARDLEDWDPLPDGAGQAHHIQLNMGTISKAGDVTPPPGLVRLGKGRTL